MPRSLPTQQEEARQQGAARRCIGREGFSCLALNAVLQLGHIAAQQRTIPIVLLCCSTSTPPSASMLILAWAVPCRKPQSATSSPVMSLRTCTVKYWWHTKPEHMAESWSYDFLNSTRYCRHIWQQYVGANPSACPSRPASHYPTLWAHVSTYHSVNKLAQTGYEYSALPMGVETWGRGVC
jgi:hypothetical protein